VRIGTRVPSSWPAVVVLAALAGPARAETAAFAGVVDLEGRPVTALPAGPGPTVLVFTRTDCPISNRYAPELRRLGQRFAARGVTFRLVYVEATETPAAIRAHARAYGLGEDVLRDSGHALVRLVGATVTPEAAVLVANPAGPRLVYRGRIDDRAVDFGRARPQPRTRDLSDVLEALTTGHALTLRTTKAVGCFIPEPR
jgi:hypothetical protein